MKGATDTSQGVGYQWRLRQLMNDRGIDTTTELRRALAASGVRLSTVAVWRLVTQPPRRLSLPILAALCNVLDCSPNELITTSRSPTPNTQPETCNQRSR
jgi:DNA-binding Xre family transcriptional regulator